jgi:hypothetical protein
MPGYRWAVSALGAALSLLALSSAATAQIGNASSVVPSARYARGTVVQDLAVNDPLEQNDRIRTAANGSTQVRFRDDTLLTVGPNSEVVLDRFIYDGSRARTATIEVVRGAMRFVSGDNAERRAYEIRTPVATIGVRGTVVDIQGSNRSLVNCVDGNCDVCHRTLNLCRTFAGGQGIAITLQGFSAASPGELAGLWRQLDGAHINLSQAIGRDPSAAVQGGSEGTKTKSDGNYGDDPNLYAANLIANPYTLNGEPPASTFAAVAGGDGTGTIKEKPFGGDANVQYRDESSVASGLAIDRIDFCGCHPKSRIRGTAGVAEQGWVSGIVGWERWTGGTVIDSHGHTVTLTSKQGVHVVHGIPPAYIPTTGAYYYDLVGATNPTVANGSVDPGTLLASSRMGVAFSGTPRVGVDLNVSIGGGTYNMHTSGGADNPYTSSIYVNGNGSFSGSHISTSLTSGTNIVCPSGGCKGSLAGSLFGPNASHLGIVYAFGNKYSNPGTMVSGAAAFGKGAAIP